jgi:hypothetical protein
MTNTTPAVSSEAVIAARTTLAAEYADLQAQIETLEERKSAIRESLIVLGGGAAGPLKVSVTVNRRVNPARFVAEFPADKFPQFWKLSPDAAKAKAALGAERTDSVYDEIGRVVKVVAA